METYEDEPKKCFESNEKADMVTKCIGTDYSYKHEIVWKNAIGFLILHLLAVWGYYILLTGGIQFKTFIWSKSFVA